MARKIVTKNRLVYGWGINDVDYDVTRTGVVNGKSKIVWRCPYYLKWSRMIQRCFCPSYQLKYPTYIGCTITDEWQRLSDFIKWVDSQPNRDWQNCVPDKDILGNGYKNYNQETVVFVNHKVNSFITDRGKARGECMVGVSFYPYVKNKPYMATCSDITTGKNKNLGRYKTEIEAHLAWQAYKHKMACLLADQQSDPRVAEALRERYSPDKDWTKA